VERSKNSPILSIIPASGWRDWEKTTLQSGQPCRSRDTNLSNMKTERNPPDCNIQCKLYGESLPGYQTGLEPIGYRLVLVSTLLHATVYILTQFAECTGTDCKWNGIANKKKNTYGSGAVSFSLHLPIVANDYNLTAKTKLN
jgi:hypothetical protein